MGDGFRVGSGFFSMAEAERPTWELPESKARTRGQGRKRSRLQWQMAAVSARQAVPWSGPAACAAWDVPVLREQRLALKFGPRCHLALSTNSAELGPAHACLLAEALSFLLL